MIGQLHRRSESDASFSSAAPLFKHVEAVPLSVSSRLAFQPDQARLLAASLTFVAFR